MKNKRWWWEWCRETDWVHQCHHDHREGTVMMILSSEDYRSLLVSLKLDREAQLKGMKRRRDGRLGEKLGYHLHETSFCFSSSFWSSFRSSVCDIPLLGVLPSLLWDSFLFSFWFFRGKDTMWRILNRILFAFERDSVFMNRTWNSIQERERDKNMKDTTKRWEEYFVLNLWLRHQDAVRILQGTKLSNFKRRFPLSFSSVASSSQVPSLHLFWKRHSKLTIPGITSRQPKEKHIPSVVAEQTTSTVHSKETVFFSWCPSEMLRVSPLSPLSTLTPCSWIDYRNCFWQFSDNSSNEGERTGIDQRTLSEEMKHQLQGKGDYREESGHQRLPLHWVSSSSKEDEKTRLSFTS
jgi:hypothetical protein